MDIPVYTYLPFDEISVGMVIEAINLSHDTLIMRLSKDGESVVTKLEASLTHEDTPEIYSSAFISVYDLNTVGIVSDEKLEAWEEAQVRASYEATYANKLFEYERLKKELGL